MIGLPFQAVSEYDVRAADVGYVSVERWQQADPDGYLKGAPDLVIEVLSSSNSAQEMLEREPLCLENGCQEFWVIDPRRQLVRVSTVQGASRTWRSGKKIPLLLFGAAGLSVDGVFSS